MRKFVEDFTKSCLENIDKEMIIYDNGFTVKKFSYEEVSQYVDRYLYLFEKSNLQQGDVVLTLLPNSPEAIICFLAVLQGGYGYAPLPCHATETEIQKWTNIIKPKIIIKKDEIGTSANIQKNSNIISICCDGNLEWLPKEKTNASKSKSGKVYLFTSGTTGVPKAMVLDGDTLWSSACEFAKFYNIEKSQYKFWNYLPMSYLGGLFNLALIPISCNGSFLITEPFSGKTIINFWNNIKKYKINAIWFVPTIVKGLLKMTQIMDGNYKKCCDDDVKIAFIGTAPIKKETKIEFEEKFGIKLYENYALSETTFITAENINNLDKREEGSVGEILPYVDVKMKEFKNSEDIYELWVKTPFIFEGYLDNFGKVNIEKDDCGFFYTKDLVKFNNNQVILVGRDREIIKKGGMFVSLKEIENLVSKNEWIKEVAAVSIEHDFYGESYILNIVPENYKCESELIAKLKLWLINNLVEYKQPETIKVYKEFPHTDSGKIRKEELRKRCEVSK